MSDLDTQAQTSVRARADFSSFSVPQYAALGLMAVAVVILAMWFMNWSTAPTWETVASGLSTDEATAAGDDLESAGLEYRLANGGSSIEVPTGVAAEARVTVGDIGGSAGAGLGYELLDEQGFMASSFRQRIDYQRAVEGELARTIVSMDDVTSATVHLAIPEDQLFSDNEDLARASVVVEGMISQGTVVSIANVVASSVPGLDSGNVTVADTSGRILSGAASTAGGDQQLQMQEVFEAQLEMAAESMLAVALGPGHAVVRVTADLDFDELESETVTYSVDEQVTLRESTLDEAFTGDNSVPLGTLGTAEEVTDAGDLAGEDGSAYLREETNREYGVPSTRTVAKQMPGSVQRLTVAVLLDESLDPAPNPAALEPLVAAAVGIDLERGDSIVVQALTFDQPEEGELADVVAAAAAGAGGGMDAILGYVKTAVAIIGLILALLFLRKGLKTLIPAPEREDIEIDPSTVEALTQGTAREGATEDEEQQRAIGAGVASLEAAATNLDAGGVDTTVDLLDLIDAQSDQVANMLRDLVSDSVS